MHIRAFLYTFAITGVFAGSVAQAACSGSLGRGWGSGSGKGTFEMAASDKTCVIDYPNFINDSAKTKIPATQVALTKAPKSGKIGLSPKGMIYTPTAGFKGKDKFCTKSTAPEVKGKSLAGCVSVTVN